MSTATIPEIFVAGTDILAADVNEDFDYLKSFLNTDVVHVDASRAFTSVPSGPSSSCTTDNQLARKKYVDDCRPTVVGKLIHTAGLSTVTTLGTITDLGLHTSSFTMPTVTNANPLLISCYIPQFLISASGGNPAVGEDVQLFLYTGGHTLLTRAHTTVGGKGLFDADCTPSVYFQRTLYSNALLAAGSSFSIELWGRMSNAGRFQTNDDATWPLEIIVQQM